MNGVVNLIKPSGMSSSDAVVRLRRIAGMKKVGHLGTLDPAAVGVLPLLLGKATRLFDYLAGHEKVYRAQIYMGSETDTLDQMGQVLQRIPWDGDEMRLRTALAGLIGEIEQIPPAYSAINLAGAKAYKLARDGREVVLPTRKVHIYGLELLAVEGSCITVDVTCSMGTYIRSLARDIGLACGTCAHVSFLERTRTGMYTLENAVTLAEAAAHLPVQPMAEALSFLPRWDADAAFCRKMRDGVEPEAKNAPPEGERLCLFCQDRLMAIAKCQKNRAGDALTLKAELWLDEEHD